MTDLVLVEWLDSCQPIPGWTHLTDLPEENVTRCVSVGWLISDGDQVKMLAPNMGDTDSETNMQASGIIRIPEACITRIVKLKESKKDYFLRLPLVSSWLKTEAASDFISFAVAFFRPVKISCKFKIPKPNQIYWIHKNINNLKIKK